MMPCLASIDAWALLAAMSWRYRCQSKSIEVLICSMMAAGPDAKRPPHIALPAMGFLPLLFLLILPLFLATGITKHDRFKDTLTQAPATARRHRGRRHSR